MFIVAFILTIFVLVVIHEFGHFFVAKKFNIKVLEFGFGIPPRVFGKKWGETLVSLNWLPFGGFVRLLGEDESEKHALDDKRSFATQKVWKRILVVVAGVTMNLILAWILFYVEIGMQGWKIELPLLTDHKFAWVTQTNQALVAVSEVSKNSPAAQAGLLPNDRIIAVNGNSLKSADDLVAQTKQNAGKATIFTVTDLGDTQRHDITITPRVSPPPGEGSLGVSLNSGDVAKLEFSSTWQKLLAGPIHSVNVLAYTGDVIGKLFSISKSQGNANAVAAGVGGPIAVAYTIKEVLNIKAALISFIDLVANMSLMLAFMNVLPIPALDGGRLFFLLVEFFTRKRVPSHIEAKIHTIGMVVLLTILILVSYKDVRVYILGLSPF